MSGLRLPTTAGYGFDYYNGKTITDKKGNVRRCKSCFEHRSKEVVEAKAKELKSQGFEVLDIYECIF